MKHLALLLAVFLIPIVGSAGFLVEPYLGYESSTSSYKFKAGTTAATLLPDTYSDTETGLGMGARFGYAFMMPFVAADVYLMSGKHKYDSKITSTEVDVTNLKVFADAGLQFPFGLRVWAGYAFINNQEIKGSTSTTKYTGTAIKVGLGYKIIPMVSLNAEYMMQIIDKYGPSGTENSVKDDYDKLDISGFFVSVSVPFEFGGGGKSRR